MIKEYDHLFKLVIIGNSGVGKSSIIGSLCYNIKDNGNGLSRYNIFRYKHERVNGITTNLKTELLGIKNNEMINYNSYQDNIWENISINSDILINIIDTPGNNIYTSIFGLLTYEPDHIIIVTSIDDTDDFSKYIDFAKKLNIPYSIIINKVDLIDNFKQFKNIIPFSCVTHENINCFNNIFNKIKTVNKIKKDSNNYNDKEFLINDVIFIPDIGIIVSGIVKSGVIEVNDNLMIVWGGLVDTCPNRAACRFCRQASAA